MMTSDKNCVIIYCFLPRKGGGRSAQAQDTSSRRHFGLQIVQTSTRSITRYMGPSSAAGLQSENPKSGRVATAHR